MTSKPNKSPTAGIDNDSSDRKSDRTKERKGKEHARPTLRTDGTEGGTDRRPDAFRPTVNQRPLPAWSNCGADGESRSGYSYIRTCLTITLI